jgi:LacI family transcriptional regulator
VQTRAEYIFLVVRLIMTLKSAGRTGIREVAKKAGVAVSSVSRVITSHPDVSPGMKERVYAAIHALGYEPDILAQSMRSGFTRTIGFLVADISNPLFSEIALGAELALNAAGHAMLIANSQGASDHDKIQLRLLRQRRVDGLILSLSDETDSGTIALLKDLDRPFVLLDREVSRIKAAAVLSDHAAGVRAAGLHLLELGHKRIGLIGGSRNVRPTRARADALLAVCKDRRGVRAYVEEGSFSAGHGEAATEALLDRSEPPTAILAGSNQILIGVLRAIRRRKLRIPRDLSLVTCDRLPLSEFIEPSLATIERNHRQMGRVAAELLLHSLDGEAPQQVILSATFDPKASCGPPKSRASDPAR